MKRTKMRLMAGAAGGSVHSRLLSQLMQHLWSALWHAPRVRSLREAAGRAYDQGDPSMIPTSFSRFLTHKRVGRKNKPDAENFKISSPAPKNGGLERSYWIQSYIQKAPALDNVATETKTLTGLSQDLTALCWEVSTQRREQANNWHHFPSTGS